MKRVHDYILGIMVFTCIGSVGATEAQHSFLEKETFTIAELKTATATHHVRFHSGYKSLDAIMNGDYEVVQAVRLDISEYQRRKVTEKSTVALVKCFTPVTMPTSTPCMFKDGKGLQEFMKLGFTHMELNWNDSSINFVRPDGSKLVAPFIKKEAAISGIAEINEFKILF